MMNAAKAHWLAAVVMVALGVLATPGLAGASSFPAVNGARPQFTTMGGVSPLPTDRTVPHWHGSFTDPTNGVTYGYNMVGNGDPRTYRSTTSVPVDIIPLNFTFTGSGGYAMNGSDVVPAMIKSPIFTNSDYTTTPEISDQNYAPLKGTFPLSSGNTAVQYEDAVMRSQFNVTGTSFHLKLGTPTVLPAQTIAVPANQGGVYTVNGITAGLMEYHWFGAQVGNLLNQLHIDPTHLPVFVTNNTMLYEKSLSNCCIIGFHGAGSSANGGGNNQVQTYAYASYTTPGTFGSTYFLQDIHALSHEISEWGDDPFVNNAVDPWVTPTAPQYGCTTVMETGDPVVGIGFGLPGNHYEQSYPAADGNWHPEDEALLPWFARESPNRTSQLVQGGTAGRYTVMGSLNPFPGFQAPATGC